ncbi:alpha/beta-hydrolase [Rickenella mellea]|uniref:Alpha/beta-hydrolase n=1 Tax=Rickenella mellea TaxID=50990 RepID=A0A4Y7Q8N1_9AGAM|nr:alpha/beta-hydrolase [Rickenella mellea]
MGNPTNEAASWNALEHRSTRKNGKKTLVAAVLALICWAVWFKWNLFDRALMACRSTQDASGGIKWRTCGDNIECGRLEVPLDYFNESAGTASLALARYLATNKTARLGTLLTNPGGPGGSGVNFIHRASQKISELLDGRYDIVSWDPRGINGTTPRVDCFDSQTEQDIFFANTHQEILPEARNLSDPIDLAVFKSQLRSADARNEVYAKLCIKNSGDALKHVGTATVVRDLDRIYRVLEGDQKAINFWGFSYGTAVGSYLVNMFPDRVGHVVIDGVVDPDMWANMNAHKWFKYDFVDTEKDLNNFYTACAEAGSERCALASNSSTAKSISKDVDKLIEKIYDHPLPVPHVSRPGILTSSMIRGLIFTYLYRPRDWPELASVLSSAIKGDGAPILEKVIQKVEFNTTIPAKTAAAIHAVTCVDTPSFDGVDKDAAFEDLVDEIVIAWKDVSPHFGSIEIDMCHHWSVRETERFTGPFNHTLSNEILIIGNTADPITPLANAKSVNNMLGDSSRLIIQDGSGHCSLAMASLCTAKALKGYFLEGKLPPNGLICPTDEKLFPPPPANASDTMVWLQEMQETLSEEDLKLLDNIKELGQDLAPFVSSFKRGMRI